MKKPINEVILDLIKKNGGVDKDIAKRLGVSPQRLGQYKNNKRKPDVDFITKWKNEFGDDIIEISEGRQTNVYQKPKSTDPERHEYRAWIDDLRSEIQHHREVSTRYLKIIESNMKTIENLSVKVAAT